VRLEASTKPPIHNLIHEFFINMAFIMACPNFKKGLKMAFGPLGVIFYLMHVSKCHLPNFGESFITTNPSNWILVNI
jgi:hypothetical protein